MNNKDRIEQRSLTENNNDERKRLKLITDRDIKRLEAYAKQVLPSDRAKAGMFYTRFRKRFLKTIEVLSYVSTLLPEKEKEHVLTPETVKPLVEAFLTCELEKESKFVTNERAFMIAYLLAMKGESGFDMIRNPYDTLLFDQSCKKKAMLLVIQLSNMKFLRPKSTR